MATYLVRVIETNELVGIFWSSSIKDLFYAIDEACNPYDCEILKLKYSGIFWDFKIPVSAPIDDNAFEEFLDDRGVPSWVIEKAGVPVFGDNLLTGLCLIKGWKKLRELL